MVVVHNSQARAQKNLMRILLPCPTYKPQVWNKEKNAFQDTIFDIIEQTHYAHNGTNTTDFVLFLETNLLPDEITLVKVIKTKSKPNLAQQLLKDKKAADYGLMVQGVSDLGDVIFQFENKKL